MATMPARGDVWIIDLGMVAKTRPCVVVSIPANDDNDRVLMTVLPFTTSTRGSRFEVQTNTSFLNSSAIDAQQLTTIPNVKLIKRLGRLPDDQMQTVESAIKLWLGLT